MNSYIKLEVRNAFPELERLVRNKPLIYLDNAASTLKHNFVIDQITQHYKMDAANIHRGVHTLSEEGTIQYEETRDIVQKFINASKREEIIFTKGTTESINLVANSFGEKFFNEGDIILISTMEHHSNIVPWQMVAQKRNAHVIEIPITDQGEISIQDFENLLDQYGDKIKMVSMAHISNSLGTINPIKDLISLTRQKAKQAKFLVDAAQSIAHLRTDVQDLDCDFLAFSAHKVYGPTGVGVLYGKYDILDQMPPYQGGGDMIDIVSFEGTTYNDLPHKFEAGTPHIAGVIAFKECFKFLESIGLEDIKAHEAFLCSYATEKLSKIPGLKILGPTNLENKSAVISFTIENAHPQDIGTLLDQQGIAIRTGHHCTQPLMKRLGVTATARASFAIYNTTEEIDRLYDGLIKTCELL